MYLFSWVPTLYIKYYIVHFGIGNGLVRDNNMFDSVSLAAVESFFFFFWQIYRNFVYSE